MSHTTREWLSRLGKGLVVWTVQALVLALLAAALPSVRLADLTAAYLAIAVIGLVNVLAWPTLVSLAVRVHPVLFPILAFALNGALVLAATRLVPGIEIRGVLPAIGVTLALTASQLFVGSVLSIHNDRAYERFAVRPLRRCFASPPEGKQSDGTPGLFFL